MTAPIDLTGEQFNRLLVIERVATNATNCRKPQWRCRCSCGNEVVVWGDNLRRGLSKSCGCLQRERASVRTSIENIRHSHTSRQGVSPTYSTWQSMLTRCENPNATKYRWYGAQGVKVCKRWHSFSLFLKDMGERPEGTTIDRIDPFGNYTPSNCRWADSHTQRINQRRSRRSIAA